MTVGLNSLLEGIDALAPLAAKPQPIATKQMVTEVLQALNSFSDIVRYLNTRRSKGATLELFDEASVQDALYLMLRPWIDDLISEAPSTKVGNRYSIKDFVSPSSKVVIEAKFIRSREHGKAITKELNDDIETYRYHPHCDDLIFFIYDPEGQIPDSAAVARHLESSRTYGARILRCHAVIKP